MRGVGFATVALVAVGIVLILWGLLDESSGDRDFAIVALGVLALIVGATLQVWSLRRT